MTFHQELALLIVDKLLIGALLLLGGFALNGILEPRKAGDELKKAVALERVKAYRELWTASIKPIGDVAERNEILEAFLNWYNKGGALFLSFEASRHFFKARRMLSDNSAGPAELKQVLSRLRTELKHDCGTYGRREADALIPEAAYFGAAGDRSKQAAAERQSRQG